VTNDLRSVRARYSLPCLRRRMMMIASTITANTPATTRIMVTLSMLLSFGDHFTDIRDTAERQSAICSYVLPKLARQCKPCISITIVVLASTAEATSDELFSCRNLAAFLISAQIISVSTRAQELHLQCVTSDIAEGRLTGAFPH
jgi:hypothetical protein